MPPLHPLPTLKIGFFSFCVIDTTTVLAIAFR
jgi:hypothetical protein